jgi:hypothetical protein
MLASIFLDTAKADYWLPSVPSEQFKHLLAKRLSAIVQEMIDRPYPEVEKELLAAGRRFRAHQRRKRYEYIVRNYAGEVLLEVEKFAREYRRRDWEQSGTARWLAEWRAEQKLQSEAQKVASDDERRLERVKVAERHAERISQGAMRHAQRMADKRLREVPAIRAAKRLSRCTIRAGLEQLVQGVSASVLGHVPEEAMRRFTQGLPGLSDQELEALRRKVPKMRKSPVAILSKAINTELASRKSD